MSVTWATKKPLSTFDVVTHPDGTVTYTGSRLAEAPVAVALGWKPGFTITKNRHTGEWVYRDARGRLLPDPRVALALKVKCPLCKVGAGIKCVPTTPIPPERYTKAMRRIAGLLRKKSHPARLARAALKFPEALT